MSTRRSVPSASEVQLAREACAPVLASITDRLLRGGLAGFVQFRRHYVAECRRAMSASMSKSNGNTQQQQRRQAHPPPSSSFFALSARSTTTAAAAAAAAAKSAAAKPRAARRVNPEGLRSVFAQSGVLVTPDEFRSVVVAYSDAVGFVIADDLLADLHPCCGAASALVRACTSATVESLFAEIPLVESFAAGESTSATAATTQGGKASESDFAAVAVGSVWESLRAVFSPTEEDDGAYVSALTSMLSDVEATFTTVVYPDGAVPAEDVVAFVVLAVQQHPAVADLVFARLRAAPQPLRVAPSPLSPTAGSSANRTSGAAGLDGTALFSIRHAGSTTQRKFEYYGDNSDRRDEWVRGRQEADARPAYQRHTVGYGGHLPEYQYRFGRTFHVIEEDLPQLTKPKAPLEPVAADWYGEGVELKDSRMNAHHYRLA